MRAARLAGPIAGSLLLLAGCASVPPDQDPTQIKLNDLDNRVVKVERVVSNDSLLQLANDVESLRAQIKALRNDVDQLGNGQESLRKQQRDLYTDLDERLKALESRGGAATVAGSAAGAGAGPAPSAAGLADGIVAGDGTDKGDYQAAFSLLKNSQYERAIAAFQKFLATYPQSPWAENAQYWLGEAFYVNKSFTDALQAFHQVSEKYPQSRKLADALLKTGYCYYELKQWDKAHEILEQVAQQFPDASAGRLAQERLAKMKSEKR